MNKFFKRINFLRILGLIILAVLLFVAFRKFNFTINAIVEEISSQSLKETAEFYARTFEIKLNDQLSMLESQSRYFEDVDMSNYTVLKNTIMSTKGMGEFKRIAVANSEGMTINYHGTTSGNIFLTEYFNQAMYTSRPKISKNITVDEDGEDVLVLAVPIIQNKKAVGVITGTFPYSTLGSLFSVSAFNGQGHTEVVSKDGQIIVSNQSYSNKSQVQNIFTNLSVEGTLEKSSIEKIQNLMSKSESGFFMENTKKSELLCYFTPVGVNDWYVFSYIHSSYIKKLQQQISVSGYVLVAILLNVFILIVVMFLRLQKENTEALNDVEKYAIANEQNQSCVFDYDLRTRKIKFSGDYEYVLGKIHNPLDLMSLRNLYVNIHEDDKNVMSHIQDFFADNQETFTSELRFKCRDGEYRWFRLSGTVVKDAGGQKIDKFVGNFTNVNAQMLHEQELRYIAETDMLSGLLNKNFFQKNVVRAMSKPSEESSGALFIIDLDNFKTTNDTLGHSMGDIAIRDTAQKISLIFSQKDILGRIGGDEFCVFMRFENVNQNVAAKIIMEKAAALNETLQEYYNNDVASVKISASIGIALWPEHAATYNELFRCADAALYYVKRHGKDSNVIFSKKMKTGEETFYE